MGSFKAKDNSISPQEITILVSLSSIKRKEEEFIIGLANKVMFMKGSLGQGSEMDEEPFGGVMEAGTRATLRMEFRADGESSTEKGEIVSTKEIGITECLTAKVRNISKTVKDTKAHLRRINSMVKAYSTKTILLFMEFGRTMSFQWSIWSNQALGIND